MSVEPSAETAAIHKEDEALAPALTPPCSSPRLYLYRRLGMHTMAEGMLSESYKSSHQDLLSWKDDDLKKKDENLQPESQSRKVGARSVVINAPPDAKRQRTGRTVTAREVVEGKKLCQRCVQYKFIVVLTTLLHSDQSQQRTQPAIQSGPTG